MTETTFAPLLVDEAIIYYKHEQHLYQARPSKRLMHLRMSLPDNATMLDIQDYIAFMERKRGFHQNKPLEIWLMFVEEVGELAKAIREHMKLPLHERTNRYNLDEEIADVFIFLIRIANKFGIDVLAAVRNKILEDEKKRYSRIEN